MPCTSKGSHVNSTPVYIYTLPCTWWFTSGGGRRQGSNPGAETLPSNRDTAAEGHDMSFGRSAALRGSTYKNGLAAKVVLHAFGRNLPSKSHDSNPNPHLHVADPPLRVKQRARVPLLLQAAANLRCRGRESEQQNEATTLAKNRARGGQRHGKRRITENHCHRLRQPLPVLREQLPLNLPAYTFPPQTCHNLPVPQT